MLSYIRGELTEIGSGVVTVEAGGIGYELFVPQNAEVFEAQIGDRTKLYVYMAVSQDAVTLYGFFSAEEKELFKMLISVSGIGPKGAIGILSQLSPDALRVAIVTEDDAAIAKAPGIGKKTARKLILELKDKIDATSAFAAELDWEGFRGGTKEEAGSAAQEAIEALTALGYTLSEARNAVKKTAEPAMDASEILKAALKEL